MFTGPFSFLFPLNIVIVFACAELSYFLIERPSLRLRDLIGARLMTATPSRSREAGVT
jgi:peptidoglycan/LPS O-acetylase OafA/YrhL